VKSALAFLAAEQLITLERRPGNSNVVTLLDERGEGRAYQHPGKSGGYIKLPAKFWTNRWIHDMSGTAIAIFLAIVTELFRWRKVRCWVSPAEARARYDLSADTWSRGVKQLRQLQLIDVMRISISKNPMEEPGRFRNAYRLYADRLNPAEYHQSYDDLHHALEETLAARGLPPHP
jgi:hypothetical protein